MGIRFFPQACDGNKTDSYGLLACEYILQQVPKKKTSIGFGLGYAWKIRGWVDSERIFGKFSNCKSNDAEIL